MEKLHPTFNFKTITDSAPDAVIIVDDKGRIQYANEQAERDFGYSREELKNQEVEILMPGQFRAKHHDYRNKYMEKPKLRRMGTLTDLHGVRKNGEEFPIDVSISPIRMENGELFVLASIRDIADKKMLFEELIIAKERAEESNRLKSAFLATISHELRTPLNHIFGFSDVLSETSEDENVKEMANLMHESCANLINIVDDIFQLALVEQTNLSVRDERICISNLYIELKNELEATLADSGKKENIKLNYLIDNAIVEKAILSDRSKIRMILSSLIKNAVKYTDKGYIELGIKLIDQTTISFSLKDTGCGVPKDKQQLIFELFTQSDEIYTRAKGGLGIGLSIALKIVNAMNGEIVVESEADQGATFTVNLPIKIARERKNASAAPSNKIPNLTGKTVLIIEDDRIISEQIERILQPTHCKVLKSESGKESIRDVLRKPDIEFILTSLTLPTIDGFRVVEGLRRLKKRACIIAMKNTFTQRERARALSAGSNDLITKPINKNLLYKLLTKNLQ